MSEEVKTVKPGWKTTEFWLTVAAMVVGVVVASGLVPETGPVAQVIAGAAAVLSSMGYSVSRGLAKQ